MIVKFNPEKTGIGKFLNIFTNGLTKANKEVKDFFRVSNSLSFDARKGLPEAFGISKENAALKEYTEKVDSAQWSLKNFNYWMLENNKATSKFSIILGKAKNVLKGIASTALNVAIFFAIGKAVEYLYTKIDDYVHRTEKLKETAQKTSDAIDDEEQKLSDSKSELEEINQKIDELLSKDSLTFVEEQDLQNLREQKALLEDALKTQKDITEAKKQDYIEQQKAAYDSEVKKYQKDDIFNSGERLSAIIGNIISTDDTDSMATYYNELKKGLQDPDVKNVFDAEYLLEANKKIEAALTERKKFYSDYLTSIAGRGGTDSDEYKAIKADYIDFLKEIGDTATLSTFLNATDGFEDAYKAAAEAIKSGKVKSAAELKDAIGENFYNIIKEACEGLGIEIEDEINNIYAEATDNLNSDYIADKVSKANWNLADKGLERTNEFYSGYLKEIQDFTDSLSDEQKRIYLGIVESADTLTAAKRLFNESAYNNNRQGYIDSHKTPLSTYQTSGARFQSENESIEAANKQFEDFMNSLSETDYQITLKLDVDASQSIEDIQKQIRDSKTEKTLKDVLSETFAGADGEDAKLEDIVSTVTGNIDKIKAKIVELNKNGITALSPSELIEFERIAPGITTELSKWENDSDKTAAAMEYLTNALTAQDNTLSNYCNNLLKLNNLSPEAANALQTLLDTIKGYENFESPDPIPDYTTLLSKTFSGSNAGGDLVSIGDKVSDLTSKVEILKTALDTLDTDRIGRAGELMYENFDDLVDSLDMSSILQNFPELADEIEACGGSAEKLREVLQNALNGIDTGLLAELNELKQTTPELSNEIDLLIGQLDKLSNYDINLDLSMDTSQSMVDDYISKMNTLADLAVMTRDSYVVAFDDIRNVSSVFPEIMNGAQILADGTVQLNQDFAFLPPPLPFTNLFLL